MTEKLIIGWAINSLFLMHLIFRHKGGISSKVIALILLAIPYLGSIFYLIFFVWHIPPPQPMYLRQNRMNHYGRTEFGESGSDVFESSKAPYETSKNRTGPIDNPAKKMIVAARAALVLIGLIIITYGIKSISQGMWIYPSWFGGGLVFGPLAILGGCLFIYVVVFKWNKI